ncbi:MAG TPA: hypothetical protein VMW47_08800 [Verrucomicrobiae bacterium]|nr:hypothetical protein [Verrucomicrobiae bacterium]
MEKKEARGNMRLGVVLVVVAMLMMAIAFGWAAFYLSASHG